METRYPGISFEAAASVSREEAEQAGEKFKQALLAVKTNVCDSIIRNCTEPPGVYTINHGLLEEYWFSYYQRVVAKLNICLLGLGEWDILDPSAGRTVTSSINLLVAIVQTLISMAKQRSMEHFQQTLAGLAIVGNQCASWAECLPETILARVEAAKAQHHTVAAIMHAQANDSF